MSRRIRRPPGRRYSFEPDANEVASFVLGALIGEPDSEESGEIREELRYELQNDEPLLRALVRHTQTMRDVGALSDDEAHYLIGFFTESFTFRFSDTDAELLDLHAQMRAVEARYGLPEEEGGFLLSEAPPEWLALSQAWDRRLDHLWAALLRDLGEPEMASILNLPEHEERWAAGVRSLHSPRNRGS
jgi:hypothetical protein